MPICATCGNVIWSNDHAHRYRLTIEAVTAPGKHRVVHAYARSEAAARATITNPLYRITRVETLTT